MFICLKNALMPSENQQVLRLRLVYFMRRFLLTPLILAFSLPTALNAGIPNSRDSKWMQIDPITASRSGLGNWFIDTEDVEIKGSKLRFWVERTQGKNEN